jgi:hypothetical protein
MKTLLNQRRIMQLSVLLVAGPAGIASVATALEARYVRIDNPTGFVMEFRQVEILSGGKNVVFEHPEMFCGTVPPRPDNKAPTAENIVVSNPREAREITNGDTNVLHRASEWRAFVDPANNAPGLNPWIEADFGKSVDVEKILLYASRYPARTHLDKGHRVIALLDEKRQVVWAEKWQYYATDKYPDGIFRFSPVAQSAKQNGVIGTRLPPRVSDWVSMAWLLDADASQPPADAAQRMSRFAARNSPAEVEAFAKRFFALLDRKTPGLEEAFTLYSKGQYQAALNGWKKYWFAKMARVNLHWAFHNDYAGYRANGDDLLSGIMVTITPGEARAMRYVPGQINWIDLPADGKNLSHALDDCERKAQVGKVSWPLLYAYRAKPDPKYIARWAEIMDDWAMNFFEDAAKTPYEVENLFTFNPSLAWQTTMEDLSDIAKMHPDMIEQMPAMTLARVQLICLEKYSTAWWRQARETVFNHLNGGICAYDAIRRYVDELLPGQRLHQEWQQAFERFITLGTERDGSLTEIGDEGHQEIPIQHAPHLGYMEEKRPAWYTPGWRNRVLEWYDNLFFYMFRHLSPGGYEHRFAIDYRPARWTGTWQPYNQDRRFLPTSIDRDKEVFGVPEVRRMLDAWGHISTPVPQSSDPVWKETFDAQQKTQAQVAAFLGPEKPGAPHINSDWMPYTGSYYFRRGWQHDDAFLAMMACGSKGGSQAPQWPYGMFYQYDFNFPLVAAQPVQVDGLPPQQLYGRMHCFQPGTKTMALTNADQDPAPHRWLSSARYDFGEALFEGGYQRFAGFEGDWQANLRMKEGPAVAGIKTLRQIIHVRGSRLFIVTDASRSSDQKPHDFEIPYTFSLSAWQKRASKPFSPEQLKFNEQKQSLSSENPDGPSVTLYQFADRPVQYQRGAEAKVDVRKYGKRLGSGIGIAEQGVKAKFRGEGFTLVSLLASRERAGVECVATIEPLKSGERGVGFHATLKDGGELWYLSSGLSEDKLVCGPGQAIGQVLLVTTGKTGTSGLLLGGKKFALNGKPVKIINPDFEFAMESGKFSSSDILKPIAPVRFEPGRNTFFEKETVRMTSQTPHVEIRYTVDGTPPNRASKLYTGPVTISENTEFAARAYRLGADGKPMAADDFEINGTKFTVPSYGWFYKKPLKPALAVDAKGLVPGLRYEVVEAPWWSLYASAHWLPAKESGVVTREMEALREPSAQTYAMRYKGQIKIPQDGTYTFHAPRELCYMDNAPSYDLRLYIDGEEWYLTQWWHGHGTWSVPLAKGFHTFQVDFADARTQPWRKSGCWRYYPRPWAIYQGNPTDILLSGPGLEKGRIPQDWLYRTLNAGGLNK